MFIMKQLFTILILFTLLVSCVKYDIDYNNLAPENSFVYKLNDTLIYNCSDSLRIDSYIVTGYEKDYRVQARQYYYQYEKLVLQYINDTAGNVYSIYHENPVFEVSWIDFRCKTYYVEKPQMVDYIINEDTVRDVYIIRNKTKKISRIYYNKQYGIIRYNVDSSRYYQLKLKKPIE
jgi:hypothetical protein